DLPRKIAHSGEVPDEKRENLVRIDEGAVAIDCTDAITVSVGGESSVVFSCDDSFTERPDVRLNRFGVNATEARITRAANFVAMDAVAAEKFRKQAGRGTVHGVKDKAEVGFADATPIHKFFECVEIRSARFERQNEFRVWREGRDVARLH